MQTTNLIKEIFLEHTKISVVGTNHVFMNINQKTFLLTVVQCRMELQQNVKSGVAEIMSA